MANKSMYTDRANKATSRAKGDFVFTQKGDGLEASKGTEVEVLLASNLDNISAPISTTYKTLTFNPLRGRAVVANSTNTKAYGMRPVDLGQESVGVRCDGTDDFIQIADNDNLDITKGFTITWFGELKLGKQSLIASKLGEYHIYKDSSTNNIVLRLIDSVAPTSRFCDYEIPSLTKDGLYFVTTSFDGTYTSTSVKISINNINQPVTMTKQSSFVSVANKTNPLLVMKGSGNDDGNYVYSEGIVNLFRLFNYAFTASDVSYYWNNGRPDLALVRDSDKWWSNTELVTNGNFSSGLTGWTVNSNISDASVSDGVLSFTGKGSFSSSLNNGIDQNSIANVLGKQINITFFAKTEVGSATLFIGQLGYSDNIGRANVIIDSEWKTYFITVKTYETENTSLKRFGFSATNGVKIYIDNISVMQAGSVADYSPASIADPVTVGSDTATITAGNTYEVTVALTSDNEVNPAHANYIGASDKAVGTRFVCVKSGTLNTTGRVKIVAVTSWLDNSTNALNATVTGNPLLVKTQVEEKQGDGLISSVFQTITKAVTVITSTDCGQLPAGFELLRVIATLTGGTGVTGLTLGNSSSGTQFLTSTSVATGETILVPNGRPFSSTANQTIYSNMSSLGGGTLSLKFIMLRLV